MAHIFTITDKFNLSDEAINSQAEAICLEEINEFELSPNSKLNKLKVTNDNGVKVYTFEIISAEGIDTEDSDDSITMNIPPKEIAAASSSLL